MDEEELVGVGPGHEQPAPVRRPRDLADPAGDAEEPARRRAEAVRGFGVAQDFRGLRDVAVRSAFLVDPGGTVRRAWRYANDEVPDFDELLQAARAS